MKVNFMLIGAMKCATTTMAGILDMHPDICVSDIKEPTYFSKLKEDRKSLEWYHSLFKKDANVYGEASTSYTKFPVINPFICDEIYEYNPEMKFIYIVRNPIDRIISHYTHIFEEGETKETLEHVVFNDSHVLNLSRYFTQINPYIKKFGRDNVLIIDFDDVVSKDEKTLKKVFEFLNVSDFKPIQDVHLNQAENAKRFHKKYRNPIFPLRVVRKLMPNLWAIFLEYTKPKLAEKPKLSEVNHKKVMMLLDGEIQLLETLMKKDLSHWYK